MPRAQSLTPRAPKFMTKPLTLCFALSLVTIPAFAQQAQFQDVVRMLRHPDPEQRLRSVEMLREAAYPEAAEPIAALVVDPDDRVQLAAIEAELALFMVNDGTRKRFGFMTSRPKSAGLAAFEAGPAAVKPVPVPAVLVDNLLTALDDATDRVRFEAVHALGALAKQPLTVPQIRKLTAALDHYDPIVRAASARVIARLQVKESEDALIVAITDSNAAVRQFAMYALGEIRSAKAVYALTHQVKNYKSNEQATNALLALAKIADPSSADLFRQFIAAKDPGHRAASAEGLARTGAADFVPQLEQRLLSERGPAVRLAYFFALQKFGRNYLEHIVKALEEDDSAPQAMEYLVELGGAVAKELVPYLASREDNVRGRVAEILGIIGGADVLPALESARLDRNDAVARAVAAAIDRIKAR